jgi:hypothetical protein
VKNRFQAFAFKWVNLYRYNAVVDKCVAADPERLKKAAGRKVFEVGGLYTMQF